MRRPLVIAMVWMLALVGLDTASPVKTRQLPDTTGKTLPGEAMYPRASKQVWDDVQGMVAQLGFRTEKIDKKRQVIVTSWKSYDESVFPNAAALELSANDQPLRLQLHVAVAPNREPARVVVGSIVEVERREAGVAKKFLRYRPAAVDAWLFASLDARAGVAHEPMAANWDARKNQATRLMPDGLTDRCLSTSPAVAKATITAPVKISDVQPVFPAEGFGSGQRKVQIGSSLTEHGTLINLRPENPSPEFAHFEASARAALGLWRFEPAMLGECPTVALFSVTVNYSVR
jgi:hypothetical protein